MFLSDLNLRFLFTIFFFPFISARNITCNRHCGHNSTVPFPFGFSDGCEIRLACNQTTGHIQVGGFVVHNITPEVIIVEIQPQCNRPVSAITKFYGSNYALTIQNGLLMRNCNSSAPSCDIPTILLKEQFELPNCQSNYSNISCVTGESEVRNGFIGRENVTARGCQSLVSVAVVDATRTRALSVEFQKVELGWWIEGRCSCSENANCTRIISPVNGKPGFRCRCYEGFEGDGFRAGNGCRRASSRCNPSRYMSGRCGGTTRIGVLVGGILVGATVVAGLAVLCFFIRRRSTSSRKRNSTRRLLSEATASIVPFYQYKEIDKATSGFSENQRLGTGAYGTVYAGKLNNDEWVAVKKIRYRDDDSVEKVMNEIKLLSSVSHPNLVRLLGCCIDSGEQILVYEFMPNGTLSQHLQREKGSGLPWTTRLTIAAETAKAIAYLHSAMNPPIFHRDIKSSNILLDYNFNSKVADFGLSRLGMTEDSHISTAPQGTPGYLDPQYHQNFHLSDKSDVYSFGVVLVEIITALKVVDFSRMHNEVNLAALAINKIGKGCVEEIIDPFLEPHRDAWTLSSVHKVAELAFRCLAFHRDMRPSMMEVAAELEHIRLSGWAQMENFYEASSFSSTSSPSNGSENPQTTEKKTSSGSRRLIVPPRSDCVTTMEEIGTSPVSVQDPWFSEQSSPSTNSLLGNVIQ